MGMCYVYAMVPQRCFIGQKNKTYEILLLLVCIDMIFHTRIDWISVCGCLCRIDRSRTPTGSNRDDRRWSRLITMAISMIAMVVAAVLRLCIDALYQHKTMLIHTLVALFFCSLHVVKVKLHHCARGHRSAARRDHRRSL